MVCIFKKFKSFFIVNLKSVGLRASKLLAVKVWEWFNARCSQIWAEWFEWGRGWPADFILWPPTLTASNFSALWPIDFIFTAVKDLNLLEKYFENQTAGSIFKVFFALSKWPNFHRAYFTTVCKRVSIAVYRLEKIQFQI